MGFSEVGVFSWKHQREHPELREVCHFLEPACESATLRFPLTLCDYFRILGTAPISGKTLSEREGHSRSSRRVPGYSRSNSRNSETDSRNAKFHSRNGILRLEQKEKTTILGATSGAIRGVGGNPRERFSFGPAFSERFFMNWGGPRASDYCRLHNSWTSTSAGCPADSLPKFPTGQGTRKHHKCGKPKATLFLNLGAELKVTHLR